MMNAIGENALLNQILHVRIKEYVYAVSVTYLLYELKVL